MQILLMDPAEGAPVGPKRRTGPFTGGAVPLTSAISIIIPRPLVHAGADGGMERRATPIALPRVGREQRAASWDVLRAQCRGGRGVCMVADPKALLARVPRYHTDDGWAIVGRGPMPLLFSCLRDRPNSRANGWPGGHNGGPCRGCSWPGHQAVIPPVDTAARRSRLIAGLSPWSLSVACRRGGAPRVTGHSPPSAKWPAPQCSTPPCPASSPLRARAWPAL
jgi:hypothetical protein